MNESAQMISAVKAFTMASPKRLEFLYSQVNQVIGENIKGDFVETGVWRGGCSMLMAKILKARNIEDRKIWMYDTYEGMSKPTDKDIKFTHGKTYFDKWANEQKEGYNEWCYASLEEVKANMKKTELDNVEFIKGDVLKTIPKHIPESISILRLDTDFHDSTAQTLKYLFPLLSDNGFLIIDDYYCWQGCQTAVDNYFSKHNLNKNKIIQIDNSCAYYRKGCE